MSSIIFKHLKNSDDTSSSSDSDDGRLESCETISARKEWKRKMKDKMMRFVDDEADDDKKMKMRQGEGNEEDENEEFEREMNRELEERLAALRGETVDKETLQVRKRKVLKPKSLRKKSDLEIYDKLYFDSDEENEDRESRRVRTDEELFYDPNMDAEDEEWMASRGAVGKKRATSSDAVLNCPACMTSLCDDCQRHESYQNQYRAMFVSNCRVDGKTVLVHKEKQGKRGKKGRGNSNVREGLAGQVEGEASRKDKFNPVHCQVCGTEVAVYDDNEIYHFYNVLASHA